MSEKYSQLIENQELDEVLFFIKKELKKIQQNISLGTERRQVLIGNEVQDLLELSNAFYYQPDIEKADHCSQEGWQTLVKEFGQTHPKTIDALSYVTFYHNEFGRYKEGRQLTDETLDLLPKNEQTLWGRILLYNNLGYSYSEEEDYGNAFKYYNKIMNLLSEIDLGSLSPDNQHAIGATFNNKSGIHIKLGSYTEAIRELEQMKNLLDENSELYNYYRFNIGRLYSDTGEQQKGIKLLEEAIQKTQDILMCCASQTKIAELYLNENKCDTAYSYVNQAVNTISQLQKWTRHNAYVYDTLSRYYLIKGDFEQALANNQISIRQSLSDIKNGIFDRQNIEEVRSLVFLTISLKRKVEIVRAQYTVSPQKIFLEQRLESVNDLDALIDKIRSNHKNQEAQLVLAEGAKDYYEIGIEAAHELYQQTGDTAYAESAFRYSEKSKAVLLLHEVKELETILGSDIPNEILQREAEIQKRLAWLDGKIASKVFGEKGTIALRDEQFELLEELRKMTQHLEQNYPDYYRQKYSTKAVTIRDLQNQLNDNQLIISYFWGVEKLYAFSISSTEIIFECLGNISELTKTVKDFLEEVRKTLISPKSFKPVAYRLYQTVLQPLIKEQIVKKIVSLPDDLLSEVSFDSLLETEEGEVFSELEYLAKKYAISTHFSATLWSYSHRQKKETMYEKQFVGFAPLSVKLPKTVQEIRGITQLFTPESSVCFIDSEANKDNFFEFALQGKFVHISSDACFNRADKDNCYIQFGKGINERLTLRDVQSLKLNAFLVVLSCCNTGKGQLRRGESMLAFNRSFAAVGAQNIIYTLQMVSDTKAAQLMQFFYEGVVKEQLPLDEALRQAKHRLIVEAATPADWSSYQLIS